MMVHQRLKKINELGDDVKVWWQQPEIQEAKNEWVNIFARTSENWKAEIGFVL